MTAKKRVVVNLSVLAGAVLGVGGWTLRSSAHYLSESFVHTDTFNAYVSEQAYIHLRDSLVAAQSQTRSDSELSQLYRACQRKGDCP